MVNWKSKWYESNQTFISKIDRFQRFFSDTLFQLKFCSKQLARQSKKVNNSFWSIWYLIKVIVNTNTQLYYSLTKHGKKKHFSLKTWFITFDIIWKFRNYNSWKFGAKPSCHRLKILFHLLFAEIFLYLGAQKYLYSGPITEISVPLITENFCEK